jgi:ATP-binding cassette, subfamily C, bacterial CydCD
MTTPRVRLCGHNGELGRALHVRRSGHNGERGRGPLGALAGAAIRAAGSGLAVARALLADREVVLLDEPTAHLDPPTAQALVADLRSALAGRLVVCVTHDRNLVGPEDSGLQLDRREQPTAVG